MRCYDGQTGIVTTVLGGTSVHDDGPAQKAYLCGPGGMSIGPNGHIYFADVFNQRIRAINPESGFIYGVAGNGARAYGGDNGSALEAYLGNPHDVSVDAQGRVVLADTRNGRLRRVEMDGIIRTICGTTLPWDGGEGCWDKGDHGPAISASLLKVEAVTHSPNGDIYLGDGVGRIRKINSETGIITTIAGIGQSGYTGDGGLATKARIGAPTAICLDKEGNLYFSDRVNHVIRKINLTGIITTLVGTGQAGFSPDGTSAQEANLDTPWGLTISPDGLLYISDSRNNLVRRMTFSGVLETVAGSYGSGHFGDISLVREGELNEPHGLVFLGHDLLLISDHFNNCIKAIKLIS